MSVAPIEVIEYESRVVSDTNFTRLTAIARLSNDDESTVYSYGSVRPRKEVEAGVVPRNFIDEAEQAFLRVWNERLDALTESP